MAARKTAAGNVSDGIDPAAPSTTSEQIETPEETPGEAPPLLSDNLYPPRENGCPECGEKKRSDGHGSIFCPVNHSNCPNLQ